MSIEILDGRESLDGGGDTVTGFRIPVVSDIADAASDAVDAVWDAVDDLPGFKQLGDGVKAVFTGPLRDFAKTAVGQTVLRAMTGMAMGLTGGIAGPWAMMATAALPGVIAGSPFEEALITENLYRATEAVKILTANQVKVPGIEFPIPPEVQKIVTQSLDVLNELKRRAAEMGLPIEEAVRKLAADYGVPDNLEALGVKLANEMGVREDFAVQAIEMAAKQKLLSHENYDMATGKKKVFIDPFKAIRAAKAAEETKKAALHKAISKTTITSVMNPGLRNLDLLRPKTSPIQASVVTPIAKPSFQAALDALRADQAAARAQAPVAPAPAPFVPSAPLPPGYDEGGERMSVLEVKSFWDQHKTKVLVGGGLLVAAGVAYYVWGRK